MVNIPNLITVFRVLIVPFFVMALHYGNFKIAFLLFVIAALSDSIDGFIARKLNQITKVGIIMDPLADKALIDSAFVVLSYVHHIIPPWLTILVISRDIIILTGGWLLTTFGKIDRVKPLSIGKLTSFSQFTAIAVTLFDLNCPSIWGEILRKLLYILTGSLTVASGLMYVIKGTKELNSE